MKRQRLGSPDCVLTGKLAGYTLTLEASAHWTQDGADLTLTSGTANALTSDILKVDLHWLWSTGTSSSTQTGTLAETGELTQVK